MIAAHQHKVSEASRFARFGETKRDASSTSYGPFSGINSKPFFATDSIIPKDRGEVTSSYLGKRRRGQIELKRFLKALFDRNHDACRSTLERPGVKGCELVDLPGPAAFRTHVF